MALSKEQEKQLRDLLASVGHGSQQQPKDVGAAPRTLLEQQLDALETGIGELLRDSDAANLKNDYAEADRLRDRLIGASHLRAALKSAKPDAPTE